MSHNEHLYGLSPVWTLKCLVRSPFWLNALSHRWKHFPHSSHLYLLLWIFICNLKYCLFEKHFWHSVHEYTSSPAWLSLPSLKRRWFANCSSHTVRTGDLGFLFCSCLLMATSERIVLQLSPTHYSAQYTGFFTNVSLLFLIICIIWVCLLQRAMSVIQTKNARVQCSWWLSHMTDCQHFIVHLAKVIDLIHQHCCTTAYNAEMYKYSYFI